MAKLKDVFHDYEKEPTVLKTPWLSISYYVQTIREVNET
jgi:hypothetical protein